MSNLAVFKNQDFGEDRTIEKNEEVWFILNDVYAILEIANARDEKSRLDNENVGTTGVIDSLGRTQKMTVINEYT